MVKRLAVLPVPGFILAIGVAVILDVRGIYEPIWLLPILNLLFLLIPGCIIAYVSVQGYRIGGSFSLLLFGSAAMVYGTSSGIGGWMVGVLGAVDAGIVLHNTGSAIGAILNMWSGLLDTMVSAASRPTSRRVKTLLLYAGLGGLVAGLSFASLHGLTSTFVLPGGGFTPIRNVTLAIAVAGFAASTLLFWKRYIERGSEFRFWGTLALAMLSIGLSGLFFQRGVGTLVGWCSRFAQYVGSVYFLIAVVRAWRAAQRTNIPVARAIAGLFREAEANYRVLVETATDAIVAFDSADRVLVWNAAAERMFGSAREEAIGAPFGEVTGLRGEIERWTAEQAPSADAGGVLTLASATQTQAMRRDGTTFPVECSASVRPTAEGLIGTVILRDITERHRMEQALKMTYARLERIASSNVVGVAIANAQGGLLEANDYYLNVLGLTRREFETGRIRWDERTPPEHLPADWKAIAELRDRGICTPYEKEYIRKDGSRVWVLIADALVPGPGEQILALVVDITERKRAEAALDLSHAQMKLAQEMAKVGYWSYDIEKRQPFWSEQMFLIFGCDPRRGTPHYDLHREFIHPDDWASFDQAVQDAIHGRGYEMVLRVNFPDQSIHFVHTQGYPQYDAQGRAFGLFGASQDITEHRRAEQALLALSLRQQALLDAIPDIIMEVDANKVYTWANQAGVEFFGKDVIGKEAAHYFIGEQDTYGMVESLFQGDESLIHLESWQRRHDGEARLLAWRCRVLNDPSGKVVGALSSARDITERKRLEADRLRLEAQLRQRQKLEAIGTLAGGVAHEINNPIAGIMNYAQLIADMVPPESRAAEYAGEIVHETERVATIVRNLLQFARQETQTHSPARLADIVEQTLTLLRAVLRRDQITLEVAVPDDLPLLKCRSQQLQQVLMNLLTNARDALNAKYPGYHEAKTLAVRAAPFEQGGRPWQRLTVADQGNGIPAELQARIFDPFFTTKPRDKGTGLGLSISHGIVQDHHGVLHFETEVGVGTKFHLELPVEEGE